jgi:hypothetical protein
VCIVIHKTLCQGWGITFTVFISLSLFLSLSTHTRMQYACGTSTITYMHEWRTVNKQHKTKNADMLCIQKCTPTHAHITNQHTTMNVCAWSGHVRTHAHTHIRIHTHRRTHSCTIKIKSSCSCAWMHGNTRRKKATYMHTQGTAAYARDRCIRKRLPSNTIGEADIRQITAPK